MVFGDFLGDHKTETLTNSIIRIGTHVQNRYNVDVVYIEFDRQKQLGNFIAKTTVQNSLKCTIIHVSTHACFAESANKHIKTRVRAKLASLRYGVPRTILSYLSISGHNLQIMT